MDGGAIAPPDHASGGASERPPGTYVGLWYRMIRDAAREELERRGMSNPSEIEIDLLIVRSRCLQDRELMEYHAGYLELRAEHCGVRARFSHA